jgi:CDP-diacylglycerol--glycerol-3-phosphate 3-phosphatidyltransferase
MTWLGKSNQQPNAVSLLRGVLGIALPFLILKPSSNYHLLAFGIYIFGVFTDYWDGWLARRYNIVSDFGKIADPTADKILILGPLVTFAYLGYYSIWWVVPIFARELIITFCRIGLLIEGKAVAAEKLGKVKLVVQAAALSGSFLIMLAKDFHYSESLINGLNGLTFFLLVLAVILTLVSGYFFFKNNLESFQSQAFAKYISAFGVGLIPFSPGTLGSIVGLMLVLLVYWNPWLFWGSFILCFVASYWAVNRLDLSYNKDPQFVVSDEVLGTFITFMFIPITVNSVLAGFFLFRIFDIVKPFPLRRLEKLHGFWGITLDDLGAGFYSWLILLYYFHP